MDVFVLGTSHSVASARVRERLFVDVDEVYDALEPLQNGREILAEAIPLVTCARLELYGVAPDVDRAVGVLRRLTGRRAGLSRVELEAHGYVRRGPEAVKHLLRVAAGLDSVVHGEAQILGQVRDAAHHSRAVTTEGPVLHRLFQSALTAGKRVRSETDIGRGAASLGSAAVTMLRRELGALDSVSALVLGAGDTGALVARLLAKSGVGRLVIANRTLERARSVAHEVGGEACPLDEAFRLLPEVDLIVGAVTAPGPILTADSDDLAVEVRSGGARYFLDLAHPRNFDPALASVPGVTLFDLEHVFRRVEAARTSRREQMPRAEAIVEREAEKYLAWLSARRNVEVLKALRSSVLDRAMAEADAHARRLPPEHREEVHRLARAMARTLLHRPTVALREADSRSEEGRELLLRAAQLFGLDEPLEDARETA